MPRADRRRREVKRRPKDRKAQIARASADAFSALGYHAVGMDDIAAAVGISATALYRHSSSKYELFRDAVMALGRQLVDCTAFADDAPDEADPAGLLDAIVAALIDTAIANRTSRRSVPLGGPVSARRRSGRADGPGEAGQPPAAETADAVAAQP